MQLPMKNLSFPLCWAFVAVACAPVRLSRASGVEIQLGQNFTGATLFTDASLVPPDSDGAIGPAHFVEFINGRFSVFDKTSGTKVQTTSDRNFWNNAGISLPGGVIVSDPRTLY